MTPERIKIIKEKFVADLEEQVWRKELMTSFDLSKIPDIERIKGGKFEERSKFEAELQAVDPADHTRETRKKKSELEKKIAAAEQFMSNCDQTVTAINIGVQQERQKSFELQSRIEFAKLFEFREPDRNPINEE